VGPVAVADGGRIRLRGKGVPQPSGRGAGDLYVVAQIKVPKGLAAEARTRIEAISELHAAALRKDLD
jgi:DnaJ-class molecular chaperone